MTSPAATPAPEPPAAPKQPPASSVLAPAVKEEYNRIGLDFRFPMPRPKVNGIVIDSHCHLLAAHHAPAWFEAADHYGLDCFVTMTPLEEAVSLQRNWGHRLQFIAVPRWGDASPTWADDWLTRIEAFYNIGSRIVKFHAAPGTMVMRGHRLDRPGLHARLLAEVVARKMVDHDPHRRPRHLVQRQVHRHRQVRHARRALPDVGRVARSAPRHAVARGAPRRQPGEPAAPPAAARPLPRPGAGLQRHPLDGPRDQRTAAIPPASSSSATRTASCSAPTR